MDKPELYFAYGSNLYYRQMKFRCPSASVLFPAGKPNSKLCFPIISKKRQNMGVASIKYKRESTVEGVVYKINTPDLTRLDSFEAVGRRYERKRVFVCTADSKRKLVWTYVAVSDHKKEFGPSDDYIDLIIQGALEHKLSKSYIQYLLDLKNRFITPA